MQLAVHESEHRNALQIVLTDEDRVMPVQRHCRDVHVGAMVRTEDILPFRIEPFLVDNLEGHADQDQQTLRPPPVEFSHEAELAGKDDRNQQQEEKNYKQDKENDHAVKRVKPPDKVHV